MSTPNGQPGPQGQDPREPAQQPSQPSPTSGPGTYGAEQDIPRQQAPRDDQYSGQGQGQGQSQHVPGQDGPWAGGQQGGTYDAYPSAGGYGPGGYPPGGPRPLSYLQGAPVGFADAVRGAMTNIVTLRGRASRSAFWWFVLVQAIAYAIISWISDASNAAGIVLDIIVGIPLFVAGIAVAVRRLHDADHAGWWWWIGWVPFVGWIVLLVFYLLPGTPGPNRYSVAG
jgi:uncharacterized membrane protein YhaH (DUF805 family)